MLLIRHSHMGHMQCCTIGVWLMIDIFLKCTLIEVGLNSRACWVMVVCRAFAVIASWEHFVVVVVRDGPWTDTTSRTRCGHHDAVWLVADLCLCPMGWMGEWRQMIKFKSRRNRGPQESWYTFVMLELLKIIKDWIFYFVTEDVVRDFGRENGMWMNLKFNYKKCEHNVPKANRWQNNDHQCWLVSHSLDGLRGWWCNKSNIY